MFSVSRKAVLTAFFIVMILSVPSFYFFFVRISQPYEQRLEKYIRKRSPFFTNICLPFNVIDYRLKPGDNLWDLATTFGKNIDTIVSYNTIYSNIRKVHNVRVGREIGIPTADGIFYKPEKDHTFYSLAQKESIPYDLFLMLHGLPSDTKPDSFFFSSQCDVFLDRVFLPGALFSLEKRSDRLGRMFLRPLHSFRITSLWGFRIHPITKKRSIHMGIDLAAPRGTPVYSAKGGVVTVARYAAGYGQVVMINHPRKSRSASYQTRYAHLSKIHVKQGQRVMAQQMIGRVGNTGISTGSHLHFEVRRNGRSINPRDLTDLRSD